MIKTIIKTSVILALCLMPGKLLMAEGPAIITDGKTVKFHYTLKVENEVVHSSFSGEPLTYVQGNGDIMPGLEKQLTGMKTGEKKVFSLPQEESYGPVDPEALVEVPTSRLPQGADKAGTVLSVTGDQGQDMRAIVKEIRGETSILDFNHPLAGKELQFDVEIVEVTEGLTTAEGSESTPPPSN